MTEDVIGKSSVEDFAWLTTNTGMISRIIMLMTSICAIDVVILLRSYSNFCLLRKVSSQVFESSLDV